MHFYENLGDQERRDHRLILLYHTALQCYFILGKYRPSICCPLQTLGFFGVPTSLKKDVQRKGH